jgi:COP9 signalosome complex subunit 4
MALEAKVAQILKLDIKDQASRISALVDEVVASGGVPSLQALALKLLAEDVNPQVSKAAILQLSSSISSLPTESFNEIACFLITNIKSHPSAQFDDSDYLLRDGVFNYCIACEEYTEAAQTLSGSNLDSTTRPFSCTEKVDIFIKCAEAVLEADEAIDAEVFVNKASALINASDVVGNLSLQLRYKVTYARVMDANRKFVEAALRYCELSATTANVSV